MTWVSKPLPHEYCSCGAKMYCTAASLEGRNSERASFRVAHAKCRKRDGSAQRVIDRLADFIEQNVEGSHVYRDSGLVVT